jgi:hypothetical protein
MSSKVNNNETEENSQESIEINTDGDQLRIAQKPADDTASDYIDYRREEVKEVCEYVAYKEGVQPHVIHQDIVDHNGKRQILLTCGDLGLGESYDRYDSIEKIGSVHDRHIYDDEMAVGYYLNFMEQTGHSEKEVLSALAEHEWAIEAAQNLENRSREQQRYELKRRAEEGSFTEYDEAVMESGSESEVAHDLDTKMKPPDSCACYGVAMWVANHQGKAEYTEGLATTKYGGLRKHAWVEIDGKVLDYTWDWTGAVPPENAIYIGYQPDWGRVKECWRHHIKPPVSRFELDEVEDTMNVGDQ